MAGYKMNCRTGDNRLLNPGLFLTVMETVQTPDKSVIIQLITRKSCNLCKSIQKQLEAYQKKHSYIQLQIFDLENGDHIPGEKQYYFTPAIWVNERLWYVGGFEMNRFHDKIIDVLRVDQPPRVTLN